MVFFLVFKIIGNMNLCQDKEFQSFPLFKLCGAISGYLYKQKLKKVQNCMSYLTISGDGFSTGKSLMEDCCMYALYGEKVDSNAPSSVPKLFTMLASGRPIYGR